MAMDAESQAVRSIETLCKLLGLHRERRWVVDAARRHPTFPSLESMAHAFSVRGLEAMALRCGYEDLREIPLPALVVVRGRREPLFCVVDPVDSTQVHFALSPDGGAGLAKAEAFQALWDGAVMIFNREGYTPHATPRRGNASHGSRGENGRLGSTVHPLCAGFVFGGNGCPEHS